MDFDGNPLVSGYINHPALRLKWSEAPWDSVLFGAPVLQVDEIEIRGSGASAAMYPFIAARDTLGCPFVSCRLPHDRLRESMLLEEHGFRFIEMLFYPDYLDLRLGAFEDDAALSILPATTDDLEVAVAVAGEAFHNERFHVDPRLPQRIGAARYQNWVRSSLRHPSQRLLIIREAGTFLAFFILEMLDGGTCYWHLTAVAPEQQGKGYGTRVWRAMLAYARRNGADRVRTSIVARNHRVMNLYSRLGFIFSPPAMTFHWMRPS